MFVTSMYICASARHVPWRDRHKGNNKKTEEQTWICTIQSLLFQSHDGRHAISTLQLIHLRLTHFQCSQYHELQSMLQIPSRLPREYESPSPDHHTRDTVVVNSVLRYSNVLHLHQRVCHKVSDTMVRTTRFTLLKIFLAYNPSSPYDHSLVGHNSSS